MANISLWRRGKHQICFVKICLWRNHDWVVWSLQVVTAPLGLSEGPISPQSTRIGHSMGEQHGNDEMCSVASCIEFGICSPDFFYRCHYTSGCWENLVFFLIGRSRDNFAFGSLTLGLRASGLLGFLHDECLDCFFIVTLHSGGRRIDFSVVLVQLWQIFLTTQIWILLIGRQF